MALMLDDDYPETLAVIAVAAYEWLTAAPLKLEHQPAAEAALSIAEAARRKLGGGHQYIPKGRDYDLSRRDLRIYGKFRGDNYTALAREFDLSEMRIRQIVEACRKADIKRRQGSLL